MAKDNAGEDIAALQARIEQLEAEKASTAQVGRPGFSVRGPVPVEVTREGIKKNSSAKLKTYRALGNGIDHKQGFIPSGSKFSTTQPKGSWMEEITPEVEAEANA